MRRLVTIAIAASFAAPALASDMLVFKRDSRYRGAALKVESLENKDGRLLIHAATGDLYTAAAEDVDWNESRRLTEALHIREAEDAIKAGEAAAAERAARLADEANSESLSVLEASRRYGVANPGMSVSDGSAMREIGHASPPARGETGGAAGGGSGTPSSGATSSAVKKAQAKLDAARADRDKIAKVIADLKADRNPDPVSASLRASQLVRRESELREADARIVTAQADLVAAQAKAAADEEAKKAGK